MSSFVVVWCDSIGLVSLILLGCELLVLYHCTMCTRHPDLVSLDFDAIPIFHILITFIYFIFNHIPNLLIILVQVSSNATSSKKYYVLGTNVVWSICVHVHVHCT